jgi:hypothetical protein
MHNSAIVTPQARFLVAQGFLLKSAADLLSLRGVDMKFPI